MKIGIVTQPLSRNYGGILQNYALQQRLIALGHTPYTFDLGAFTWWEWVVGNVKWIVKRLIGREGHYLSTPKARLIAERPLRRFVEEKIALIAPRAKHPSLAKVEEYDLEALIVGSDQVWRPRYNYAIEDMYLGFARTLNIRRIAYAASFGTEEWEYSEKQTAKCRELITMFDALSLREDSGVELCRKHFGVEAQQVLDPTLLLTAEEYNTLTSSIPQRKEPILFAYLLDRSAEKLAFVEQMAKHRSLSVVVVGADGELQEGDSIEQWLSYFRDARYVVTDSFHGSAFSVIYNREFTVMGNPKRGNSRMMSLLRQLGIEERYCEKLECVEALEAPAWDEVNSRLKQLRDSALQYLEESLKKEFRV